MRVVVDTNIVVSSYLTPQGKAAQILSYWKDQVFDLIVSEEILSEYQSALLYPRVQKLHCMTKEEVEEIIDDFRKFAIVVNPKSKISVVKDDPDDNKFLECAEEGGASYVVSGDGHLLGVGEYKNIQALSPATFIALLREEAL
jgi:putative PIN family toxin of toxin-antitoxin system